MKAFKDQRAGNKEEKGERQKAGRRQRLRGCHYLELCWLGFHFHYHPECQGERRQRARGRRRQSQLSREHTGEGDVLGWDLNSSHLPSSQLRSEDRSSGPRTCMAENCKGPE